MHWMIGALLALFVSISSLFGTHAGQISSTVATSSYVSQVFDSSDQSRAVVQQATTVVPNADSTGVASSSSGLQTYTNAQYGFTFQYPSSLRVVATIDANQGYGSVELPTTPAPLVSLLFDSSGVVMSGFSEAGLVVRADSTVSYEDCTRMINATNESPNLTNTERLTINGQVFYKDVSGDAALGHFWNTDTYRTYYNGTCFEITDDIASARVDSSNPALSNFAPATNAFDTVLKTFRFTVPAIVPPIHSPQASAWKTYVGAFPFTFQYPGTFVSSEQVDTTNGLQVQVGEVDVKEGQQVGLEKISDGNDHGWISVQQGIPYNGLTATQEMQQQLQQEMQGGPTLHPSFFQYSTTTFAGETAYVIAQTVLSDTSATIIYTVHGQYYYRIVIFNYEMPADEYDTFLNSFRFTN